jgi:ABC-type molybdate transport system substrate-binding protein
VQLSKTLLLTILAVSVSCNKPHPQPTSGAGNTAKKNTQSPSVASSVSATTLDKPKVHQKSSKAILLRVIAAPSLSNSLHELARTYNEENLDGVTVSILESDIYSALKRLGAEGGDVLVTEGFAALELAKAARLAGTHPAQIVTYLSIGVKVRGEKAGDIKVLSDLAKDGVRIGIASPKYSTGGRAARRLLRRAKLGQGPKILIIQGQAKNALKDGIIDAFIGWGRLGGTGVPLRLDAAYREVIPIPAVVTELSKHVDASKAFVAWLTSDTANEIWQAAHTHPLLHPGSSVLPTILPTVLPDPRHHAGAVVVGDRILLVGGESSGKALKKITWYDPRNVAAKDAETTLPFARSAPAVVYFAAQKKVYIAGGKGASGPTVELYRYDPERDQLELLAQRLPLPVSNAATLLRAGSMFLFGGLGTADALLDTVVQLDLNSGASHRLAVRFPIALKDMAATPGRKGKILLAGGAGPSGPNDELWNFDPESHEITRISSRLSQQLSALGVVPWKDGWLIMGGLGTHGPSESVDMVYSDRATKKLSHRLPYPVHGAAVIQFGEHVYIIGGLSNKRVESRIIRYPY